MYVNKPMKEKKKFRWWKIPLIIIAVILVVAIVYVSYVFISYSRIDDGQQLIPAGSPKHTVAQAGKEYTALSYNVGFGAYTPDFTFFMDGGKSSWAKSKESVVDCINGAASVLREHDPDFMLIQEVDFDSTRSYHVNQQEMFENAFPDYSAACGEMCEENGWFFADNDDLVEEHRDLYDIDGIHFQQAFYPFWAVNLIDAMMRSTEEA